MQARRKNQVVPGPRRNTQVFLKSEADSAIIFYTKNLFGENES